MALSLSIEPYALCGSTKDDMFTSRKDDSAEGESRATGTCGRTSHSCIVGQDSTTVKGDETRPRRGARFPQGQFKVEMAGRRNISRLYTDSRVKDRMVVGDAFDLERC